MHEIIQMMRIHLRVALMLIGAQVFPRSHMFTIIGFLAGAASQADWFGVDFDVI